MLRKIEIEHFKSLEKLEIDLGRVNVIIGENGAGKSNILEAISFASAAYDRKLDNEFLGSRGIRTTRSEFMHSAFDARKKEQPISLSVTVSDGTTMTQDITSDGAPYPEWSVKGHISLGGKVDQNFLDNTFRNYLANSSNFLNATKEIAEFLTQIAELKTKKDKGENFNFDKKLVEKIFAPHLLAHEELAHFSEFLVFTPEDSTLRSLDKRSQIEPLGINGEGLFRLLRIMDAQTNGKSTREISKILQIFGWFKGFSFRSSEDALPILYIRDQYVSAKYEAFDSKSANEGFLFALFYIALFKSSLTPNFFAIDNIDAALNPKLCERLMVILTELAKNEQKQVVLTTHNPAMLDGLDLNDDEQRLFVASRGPRGRTRIRRILQKSEGSGTRLSQLFVDGLLGGLPKNF